MLLISSYIMLLGLLRIVFNEKKYNKYFITFAWLGLVIITALRYFESGTDLDQYIPRFNNLKFLTYQEVIDQSKLGTQKDLGFYLFSKFISSFGATDRVYIGIIGMIYISTVFHLIKTESKLPLLSIIIFISLGFYAFALTGLRQSIAMSFTLISYKYLKKDKIIAFVTIVLIGFLFHSSALIFLIIFPITKFKKRLNDIVILGVSIVISLFFDDFLREIVRMFGWNETLINYANQSISLSYAGFIIQLSIYSFCTYYKKNILAINSNNKILFDFLLLGVIFQLFATTIAEFFRVSMYFSIFSIILIPIAVVSEKNRAVRLVIYFFLMIIFITYIYWSGEINGFRLYWQ